MKSTISPQITVLSSHPRWGVLCLVANVLVENHRNDHGSNL